MGKLKTLLILTLLLHLAFLGCCVSAHHYYIVPITSQCHTLSYNDGTCLTLDKYASSSNLFEQKNLTLSFLPGNHSLTRRLQLNGFQNITLTGKNSSNNIIISTIMCQGISGFEFKNIQRLKITFLKFAGCGNVTRGGAMYISWADNVQIKGCHFTDNYVEGNISLDVGGGAIYAKNITAFYTEENLFNNNYAAASVGGSIYVSTGNIYSIGNQYINNSGFYGGAIYVYPGNICYSNSDQYMNNKAGVGGAIYIHSGNISTSLSNQYLENSAIYGGVIYAFSSDIYSTHNQYINNSAVHGGAIRIHFGNMYSTTDQYINNSADNTGGAIYVYSGNIYSTGGHYNLNSADGGGGAIAALFGNIYSTSDQYTNNSADDPGGAISIYSGNIRSTRNHYIHNSANGGGGAMLVFSGSIYSTNDLYVDNSAGASGGALYVFSSNISSTSNQYLYNSANNAGGVIYALSGNIYSVRDQYISNSADIRGGAIYVHSGSTKSKLVINDANFSKNFADEGAVLHSHPEVDVQMSQTNISEKFASSQSTMYIIGGSLLLSGEVNFKNNGGSLYVISSQVEFKGVLVFMNNIGYSGGAITAILSQISCATSTDVTISNNIATNGGGISLTQSNLYVYHSIELTNNHATDCGGGIYAYQSVIEFTPAETQRSSVKRNTASKGGAICATASNIVTSNMNMDIFSNTAKVNGGAMYLQQNSKLYVQRYDDFLLNTKLKFTNNSAEKGGAIYVADNTNDAVLCQQANKTTYQTECFIQIFGSYQVYVQSTVYILFSNNTAHQSGRDIYGGLLDRCTINKNAELAHVLLESTKIITGFDYLKAITKNKEIAGYSMCSNPCTVTTNNYNACLRNICRVPRNCASLDQCKDNGCLDCILGNITRADVKTFISSDPVGVEFCVKNIISPNYSHPDIMVKKGRTFTVSLVTVDQVGNPLDATIMTSFQSTSGNGRLKEGQVEQQVGNQCTAIEYNVYSQDSSAKIHIHADGPCGDKGISKKELNVIFLPCTCPVGFQPSSGPSENDCICECGQSLKDHQIKSCSYGNQTITVETNIWIGLSNQTFFNETQLVIHDCPFDYCVEKPLNISLSSQVNINRQCAYNRTGVLCGMCEEGLSLVLGSSRCKKCSNDYLSLFIPFALAGIALVAFIMLLNMTVATGTIYGLIFYASIVTANHSLFLPVNSKFLPLTIFISWLNLDLGIETCLFDGMDSYAKFLLQLAFPIYVFVIIGTIIALCKVSSKFAALLGNRNPVATLCTLILLSYSKLIRTIITALQFVHLNYQNGPFWLYDANVAYFSLSHIPRFIAAFVIIIVGVIYTILLLFGQLFFRCSNRKCMKWVKNTKYNAFIDAYHAPFIPKQRYWLGLLLLAQIILNLVAAMATGLVPIFSTGCIAIGLMLLRTINSSIYKNGIHDSLETLFLTNIIILSVATIFLSETSKDQYVTYHIIETNAHQIALANTSMAISFILFLAIVSFHIYKYILKGTQLWIKLTQLQAKTIRRLQHHKRRREFDLIPLDDDDDEGVAELERETEPIYTNDNNTGPNDVPCIYDPPNIVPAVRYDQLRQPDLDIIDPITTDDYRQVNQPPAPRPRQVPTTTIIDLVGQ